MQNDENCFIHIFPCTNTTNKKFYLALHSREFSAPTKLYKLKDYRSKTSNKDKGYR